MTKTASPCWPTRWLKFAVSVMPSNVDKLTDPDHVPVRVCNYTDVYKNDRIMGDMDFMTASATPAQISRFSLRGGDVLITKDSETPDDIAVPAYVDPSATGVVCGYHLALLRPIGGRMLGRYLFWAICSRPVASAFTARAQGITRFGLTVGAMGNVPIPVPPTTEQRAIADFLDRETAKIDVLIAAQERLIALLDEKRQATITRAVTKGLDPTVPMQESGVRTLGKVKASWPVVRLKTVLRHIEQGWSPQCENRPAEPDEWGVLKVGCVNGTHFDAAENKALPPDLDPIPGLEVKPGDILMSRANTVELIGSVSLVGAIRQRLLLCDKLYRLHTERRMVDPRFIIYLLTASTGRAPLEAAATGASPSMKNISQEAVKDVWLACPPLAEQNAIADFLDDLNDRVSATQHVAKALSEKLHERRTALITAAVIGQIDVTRSAITEAAE